MTLGRTERPCIPKGSGCLFEIVTNNELSANSGILERLTGMGIVVTWPNCPKKSPGESLGGCAEKRTVQRVGGATVSGNPPVPLSKREI